MPLFSVGGLPVGLSLIGAPGSDLMLLAATASP
jgi:Asp-tRNA(Asn)/Glu-tRNA(Gln) amidotransferase A subunit family amidase